MKLSLLKHYVLLGILLLGLGCRPEQAPVDELDMTAVTGVEGASRVQGTTTTQGTAGTAGAQDMFSGQKVLYRCPMHPQVTDDHPSNCPICGMKLEKVETAVGAGGAAVDGRIPVQISAQRQQLIGVKTTAISAKGGAHMLNAVAQVEYNEKALTHVHTKVSGWIEKLHVNFTGQYVRQGQPLLALYSPELVAAQEELLIAQRTATRMAEHDLLVTAETTAQLAEAAAEKLRLFDLTPAQIAHIRTTGQIQRTVTIYAPTSGYVTAKQAIQGLRVTEGTDLFTLANLNTVWLKARIFEADAGLIRLGQAAEVTLPFLPGQTLRATVDWIDPSLDPQSRTLGVRLNLPNPGQRLKPEMFAQVRFTVQRSGAHPLIPTSAVMDSGLRQLVFVAKADGHFEPVAVRLGRRMGNSYELLQGPPVGAKVVTEANFFVDAESQLQASLNGLSAGHNH